MTDRDAPPDDEPAASGHPDETSARMRMRRKVIAVVALLGVCMGVVVIRAFFEGRSALSDGDAALERGELREAVSRWRRAARWYVPLAPHVDDAYRRLESLAADAEAKGDIDTALMAWRGVRGSILATRSFYTPHSERLAPANRRIAALMARQEADSPPAVAPEQGTDEAGNRIGTEAWHYRLLTRDDSPSVFWSIVALLGFATWIGGGLLFALRGVTSEDRLVPRMAAYAGVLIVVGLLLWMLGLYSA